MNNQVVKIIKELLGRGYKILDHNGYSIENIRAGEDDSIIYTTYVDSNWRFKVTVSRVQQWQVISPHPYYTPFVDIIQARGITFDLA